MKKIACGCAIWLVLICSASAQANTTAPDTTAATISDCFLIDPVANPDRILAACTSVLKTDLPEKDQAIALFNRGVALRELDEFDESLSDLKASLKLLPDTSTQRMLAWTYREMGAPLKAEEIYTEVLSTDDNWQGWFSRCVTRQDMQNFAQAAPDCQAALSRNPNNKEILYFTARALNFLSDGKASLPLIRRVVAAEPNNPLYESELVWALYYSGQTRRAIARAQVLMSKNPDNAVIQEFLNTVKP